MGSLREKNCFWDLAENRKSQDFSDYSKEKETMRSFIILYTKAGNLYYTDDCLPTLFLPICGNHVVVLKEKELTRDQYHIKGIKSFWSFAKH